MNQDIILWIIGIIIAFVLCIIGIYYTLKARNKVQLTFFNESAINMYESIGQTIDGLEVLYKNKPIDSNLKLITIGFINTGNVDIDKQSIYSPISIKIPDNFIIHDLIIADSKEIKIESSLINQHQVELSWDLLKIQEYFKLIVLVQFPSGAELNPFIEVNINHRITNLNKVEKINLEGNLKNNLMLRLAKSGPFLITLLILFFLQSFISILSVVFVFPEINKSIPRFILENKGQKIEVRIYAINKDTLIIKGVHNKFYLKEKWVNLFTKYKFISIKFPAYRANSEAIRLLFYSWLFSTLLLVALLIKRQKKYSKFKALTSPEQQKITSKGNRLKEIVQ